MKKMKRLVALALSVVMVLAMSVFAFADTTANTVTVTVPDEVLQGHTFVAYQIFTGNQTGTDSTLTDVQWGADIESANFLTALKGITVGEGEAQKTPFASCETAADVAKVLGTVANDSDMAKKIAKLALANKKANVTGTTLHTESNELASGYYLIEDKTDTANKDDASNAALLQVTKNITIAKKTDKPSVEKKVKENIKNAENDSNYGNKYNDVADYNMGDPVPFHLIGTVPDMSNYDTYKYIFHDTLCAGLTAPNVGDIKVYLSGDQKVDKGEDSADTDITSHFEISLSSDKKEITVKCGNLKEISNIKANQYIIVEYSAVLNQNAAVGLPGNENKVRLEYSNNPDQSGSGENTPTGETPEDKVIVFTYKLDVTKVDAANKDTKLKDAKFKLRSGNEWAKVDENGKITGWTTDEDEASTLTSDDNGLFHVIGLDSGTYYLKETKAPSGYNILTSQIKLEITATTVNNQNWSEVPSDALKKITVKVDNGAAVDGVLANGENETDKAGSVSITVENSKGSKLPSTGGIGTTIFYVIGGILMVGAAILLITKRRTED